MINTETFEYSSSVWADIFKHLKSKGFDVFSPSEKIGECDSEYIVVSLGAVSKLTGFSTNVEIYDVMCYVPKNNYSKLEPLKMAIKRAMKEIEPLVKPYGTETDSFYDDSVKAHMVSIQYKNYKKMM